MEKSNKEKRIIIDDFKNHVSSGKVATFKKYGMDFVMGKREGAYFWDITGKTKLINCHSNGGVFNLGHKNKEIIQALKEATEDYDIGNHHLISEKRAELALKLTKLSPKGFDYTVFGVSGGEAIDLAMKLARGYTGRNNVVSIKGGYHGHTGFALSAGDDQYKAPFGEMMPGFSQIPFNDISAMKEAIQSSTAAVILETVPATMGMAIPDKEYLQAIRKFCNEKGALLILDEVQAGLGRTGKFWAFEHFNVEPDIIVTGKGLSGGIYPISATIFRKELEIFFNKNPFIHISTFGGSEIGSHVALKVLEISSSPEFLAHVNDMGRKLSRGFNNLIQKYPKYLVGYNQLGLMFGLIFKNEDLGVLFTKAAYESGMFSLYSNNDKKIAQMLPPLIITDEQVDEIIEKTENAIKKLKYYSTAYNLAKLVKLTS